jgi:hypothetical protein
MNRKLTGLSRQDQAALRKHLEVSQLCQALRQRGVDLAASKRQLKQEIARRKSVEESLTI